MASEKQKILINSKLDVLKVCQALPHFYYRVVDNDNSKIICKCPDHRDDNPSAFIDIKKNRFHCSTCKRSEYVISTFIRYGQKTKFFKAEVDALVFLQRFANIASIDLTFVEQYHSQLMSDPSLQTSIATKGITEDLLRQHRIGIHSHNGAMRYVIPVFSETGSCNQCLTYLPNAPSRKMYVFDPENKSIKSSCQLFMPDQMKYKQIVLCGGPLKAIIAAEELNKHDVGAVSFTTGEHQIPEQFRALFADHIVYVCYDIDPPGDAGAKKALQSLTRCGSVGLYKINLPLDIKQYPKGDITNYIVDEKKLLFPLLSEALPFDALLTTRELPQDIVEKDFLDVCRGSSKVNELYRTDIKCLGYSSEHQMFAREVSVQCSRDTRFCDNCPIINTDPNQIHQIDLDHPKQLQINSHNERKRETAFKAILNIPPKCNMVSFYVEKQTVADEYTVTALRNPNPNQKASTIKAFFIDKAPPLNELFLSVTARHVIAEGSGTSVLMVSNYEKSHMSLAVELVEYELSQLVLTQPKTWTIEDLQAWFNNRYGYLSSLHRIFGRAKMNFLIDLTFHSVLQFNFNNMTLNGWLNLLVLGDTGTGKSTMLKKLFDVYQIGSYFPQAQGSRAGWIGGSEKGKDDRMSFKPGVLPSNDGGLVCIEELKSLDALVLQSFLTAMSDGSFSLTNISSMRAQARVRLILTSNAREARTLYTTPRIHLLGELLGTEEALRRFDIAMALLKDQKFLDDGPKNGEGLTEELLANLVRFAWTINSDQIKFEDEAIDKIFEVSNIFSERYQHPTLLLVDSSSQHNKFARLAVAFACLTYSIDNNNSSKQVLVRKCHVEFLAQILQEIYDGEELDYRNTALKATHYVHTEFDKDQSVKLISLTTSTVWSEVTKILNATSGRFDANFFYAQLADRQVAVGIFALCQELGFVQALPDNRHYAVTERWRKYFISTVKERDSNGNVIDGSSIVSRKDESFPF